MLTLAFKSKHQPPCLDTVQAKNHHGQTARYKTIPHGRQLAMAVINRPCGDASCDCPWFAPYALTFLTRSSLAFPSSLSCFTCAFHMLKSDGWINSCLLNPPVLQWQLDFLSTSLAVAVLFVENNAERYLLSGQGLGSHDKRLWDYVVRLSVWSSCRGGSIWHVSYIRYLVYLSLRPLHLSLSPSPNAPTLLSHLAFFKMFSMTSNHSHIFLSASFCSSLSSSHHFCISVSLAVWPRLFSTTELTHSLLLFLVVILQAWSEVCVPRSTISPTTQTTTKMLQSICCVSGTHTHTHTHIQPVQHTHLSWTQHTHTHYSLQHTRIQKGQKGVVGGHQYTDVRFKQSVPGGVCNCVCVCVCVKLCVCVCVSAQCAFVYVFKCPGAWGWESGGVQKAFSFFFSQMDWKNNLH